MNSFCRSTIQMYGGVIDIKQY